MGGKLLNIHVKVNLLLDFSSCGLFLIPHPEDDPHLNASGWLDGWLPESPVHVPQVFLWHCHGCHFVPTHGSQFIMSAFGTESTCALSEMRYVLFQYKTNPSHSSQTLWALTLTAPNCDLRKQNFSKNSFIYSPSASAGLEWTLVSFL